MSARVSVIIATHSRPHLLPRAVESVLGAARDVEVVVVDDASTDATQQVCAGLKRIRYVRLEQNRGTAGARNAGILASTGRYLTFHDDDDVRVEGSLDRQCDLLDANPEAGLCYARINMGDPECRPTGHVEPRECKSGDLFWDLLVWNTIFCLTAVARRDAVDRVGLLDPAIAGIDDWDLWVRLAEQGPVVALEEIVGTWRESTPHSVQGSSVASEMVERCVRHQEALLKLPRAQAASEAIRRETRKQRLNQASDWLICHAAEWLKRGAGEYARTNLLAAIRLNPQRAIRSHTLRLIVWSLRAPGRVDGTGPTSGPFETHA
ncbi:MAG: glycosyltransferase family 2 protein [Actinomycetota bacterium]